MKVAFGLLVLITGLLLTPSLGLPSAKSLVKRCLKPFRKGFFRKTPRAINPSESPQTLHTFQCPICLSDRHMYDADRENPLTRLNCSHHVCFECMRRYVAYQIEVAKAFRIVTPCCSIRLTHNQIDRFCAHDRLRHQWQRRLALGDVARINNFLYQPCPSPDCGNICKSNRPLVEGEFRRTVPSVQWSPSPKMLFYEADRRGVDKRRWQCDDSSQAYCLLCLSGWVTGDRSHTQLSCQYFNGSRSESDSLFHNRSTAQRCPGCRTWVILDVGCAQMICSVCSRQFKWDPTLQTLPSLLVWIRAQVARAFAPETEFVLKVLVMVWILAMAWVKLCRHSLSTDP